MNHQAKKTLNMSTASTSTPLLSSAQQSPPNEENYDATSGDFPLNPTGRGKLRFEMRQQRSMKSRRKKGEANQYGSIFHTMFAAQKFHGHMNKRGHKSEEGESKKHTGSPSKKVTLPEDEDPKPVNKSHAHSLLFQTLSSKSHSPQAKIYQKFITFVILIDSVVYILSTEPKYSEVSFFYYFEGVTSSIFLVEYISRIIICTQKKRYAKYGPILGRWKYICSSQALIDGMATLPFFIELFTGVPLPTLTYLRIFRLLRITRTASYSRAMDAVGRVFYFNREILYVAALLGMYLVLFTSILMYYLRPRGDDIDLVDDPTDFASIASTMVLSLLMLTGQGGPSGNLPWYTQLVVLLTGIFSVAMFAIPASMLTWGFEAEAERLGTRAKKRATALKNGHVYISDTSSSSSGSGSDDCFSTSDEEYMKIIGGEDEDPGTTRSFDDDLVESLQDRLSRLESAVAQTNSKIDLILEKMK
mmetsp:Transcript_28197/g.56307  ORF Transcript_28197/g.56307 Transcript_28197/m.56307 type:complete len:473 (-) Transcript_28197:101-1519(-)